jgi:hypothetical protein
LSGDERPNFACDIPERGPARTVDADVHHRLTEVLAPFGATGSARKRDRVPEPAPAGVRRDYDSDNRWDHLKQMALDRLDAWVPHLNLPRCRPKASGYEAVAHWRKSSTG